MNDIYDIAEKNLTLKLNNTFGDKNEHLKIVTRLNIIDDKSEAHMIRTKITLEKIRQFNEKYKREIDMALKSTIDENGDIIDYTQDEVIPPKELSLKNTPNKSQWNYCTIC